MKPCVWSCCCAVFIGLTPYALPARCADVIKFQTNDTKVHGFSRPHPHGLYLTRAITVVAGLSGGSSGRWTGKMMMMPFICSFRNKNDIGQERGQKDTMIQDHDEIVIQDSDEDDEGDDDQRLARRLAAQETHQMLLQVSLLLFFSPHSRAGQRSLGTGQRSTASPFVTM